MQVGSTVVGAVASLLHFAHMANIHRLALVLRRFHRVCNGGCIPNHGLCDATATRLRSEPNVTLRSASAAHICCVCVATHPKYRVFASMTLATGEKHAQLFQVCCNTLVGVRIRGGGGSPGFIITRVLCGCLYMYELGKPRLCRLTCRESAFGQ